MKKVRLDSLYFGIKLFSMSYSNKEERKVLKTYNLFDFSRVKWSVAKYVTMTKEERKSLLTDPLHFCFGDIWSRCEYEYIIRPTVSDEDDEIKIDAFQMYVEPNADYLMSLVDSVSLNSAKTYLRKEKKRRLGK